MMPLKPFLNPSTQRLNQNRLPRCLKEIPGPPLHLYCVGQMDLCLGPKIAMVGSRAASWHGLQFAEQLAGQLAALGFVVVSGLARGIDAASHRGALAVGGKTIAVLGQGCDVVYPKQTRRCTNRLSVMAYLCRNIRMARNRSPTTSPPEIEL